MGRSLNSTGHTYQNYMGNGGASRHSVKF